MEEKGALFVIIVVAPPNRDPPPVEPEKKKRTREMEWKIEPASNMQSTIEKYVNSREKKKVKQCVVLI